MPKLNFQKNKVTSGKTPYFVRGPFCNPQPFNFCQDRFAWKCCAFNCSTLNKKIVLQFSKRDFSFSENFFKINLLKKFKISSDCHRKTCQSLGCFKNPQLLFFERNLRSFCFPKTFKLYNTVQPILYFGYVKII